MISDGNQLPTTPEHQNRKALPRYGVIVVLVVCNAVYFFWSSQQGKPYYAFHIAFYVQHVTYTIIFADTVAVYLYLSPLSPNGAARVLRYILLGGSSLLISDFIYTTTTAVLAIGMLAMPPAIKTLPE